MPIREDWALPKSEDWALPKREDRALQQKERGSGLATTMERAGPCNKRGGGFGLATKMKRVEGWALQQNRKKKREGWTNRTRGLGLANRIGEDWALQTE